MATIDPDDHRENYVTDDLSSLASRPQFADLPDTPVHAEGQEPIGVDPNGRVEAFSRQGYFARVEVDRDIRRRATVVHAQFEVPYDVLERNDVFARAVDAVLKNTAISGPNKLRAIATFMETIRQRENNRPVTNVEPECLEKALRVVQERDAIAATMNQEGARCLDLGDEEAETIGRSDKKYPALGPA